MKKTPRYTKHSVAGFDFYQTKNKEKFVSYFDLEGGANVLMPIKNGKLDYKNAQYDASNKCWKSGKKTKCNL